jgi:DNA repair exonuclease SbcCD ATPase subunit
VIKPKYLLYPALVCLVALPIISGIAWAEAATASSSSPLTAPPDPEQATTLAQRLTQRKSKLKTQLTSIQSQNIVKKCSAAQTSLQAIKLKDQAKANARIKTYTDLATQLSTIINRLEKQKINVDGLKATQTKFNDAINQYLTDNAAYKTALDDAIAINCGTDPVGFETTLISTRQLRTQLSKDSAQIKAVVPDLAKVLSDAKAELLKNTTKKNGAS